MHFSIDRTVHTTAFDKPVVDHWFKEGMMDGRKEGSVLFNDALTHFIYVSTVGLHILW